MAVKFFCGFFILLYHRPVFSQVYYSTNPRYLNLKTEGNLLISDYKASYPDTSIANLHNFFSRNFMGNLGQPSPDYILTYGTSDLGFRFYSPSYAEGVFTEKEIEFYRSKGPYASLTGVAGSKQLQVFKMLFTHTYKDKINLTLRFNRYTSTGFYQKQQTYTNNFYLTSNSAQKNERAGYYFYYLNNSNRHQENGGIVGDTFSVQDLTEQKELLGVNLSSAVRHNKENKLMFNPWIRLNKAPDSLNRLNSYLQVKSRFALQTFMYQDQGAAFDGFYRLFYFDTLKTNDSSRVMKFTNEVSYSLLKGKRNFGITVGYRNEVNRLWQKEDSAFTHDMAFADLVWRKDFKSGDSLNKSGNKIENASNAQYIVSGPNTGNYQAENKTTFCLNGKIKTKLFLNLATTTRNPDHIYNHWVSNHFTWFNNAFRAQQTYQAQAGVAINGRFGVSALFQNIHNLLYFDELAYPRQYAGPVHNLGITGFFSIVVLKHLGVSARHVFQSTSAPAYISIPQNISTVKLFYTGSLFKNNLQLNVGVQGQLYQSFYGYSYMPSTQAFYLQRRITTGDYPFVDIYLNARIRPVSVFIKMENALQNYAGAGYSFVTGYYQPDRSFRFGITWTFFD